MSNATEARPQVIDPRPTVAVTEALPDGSTRPLANEARGWADAYVGRTSEVIVRFDSTRRVLVGSVSVRARILRATPVELPVDNYTIVNQNDLRAQRFAALPESLLRSEDFLSGFDAKLLTLEKLSRDVLARDGELTEYRYRFIDPHTETVRGLPAFATGEAVPTARAIASARDLVLVARTQLDLQDKDLAALAKAIGDLLDSLRKTYSNAQLLGLAPEAQLGDILADAYSLGEEHPCPVS